MNYDEALTCYPVSMETLFQEVIKRNCSDLHLVAGSKPIVRSKGKLIALDYPLLTPGATKALIYSVLDPQHKKHFEEHLELDTSCSLSNIARFRGNIMMQRGSLAGAFRLVPFEIPKIEQLGLPKKVRDFCFLPRGLVLITGPAGSGKSTTLAAMIDLINREREVNIVTVEDPIEFLHKHKKAIIKQREVGLDTHSFANALKHVLRHDPDVVLIGEMRDIDSISIALTAAETGHLVFSTLHTQNAPATINRIIGVFEEHKKEQIRQQLSDTLKGVISQQLLPTSDGGNRVLAVELMRDTPAISSMIREDKSHQLYSAIQTGRPYGMQTMDQALAELFIDGKITKKNAIECCTNRIELDRIIQRIGVSPEYF